VAGGDQALSGQLHPMYPPPTSYVALLARQRSRDVMRWAGQAVVGAALLSALTGCAPVREASRPQLIVVRVDAAKGTAVPAFRLVAVGDQVRVSVENVNPFVHQYRIHGTQTTYTESAIADFAKLFGLTVSVPAPSAGAVSFATARSCSAEGTAPDADVQAASLRAQTQQLADYRDGLGDALRSVAVDVEQMSLHVSVAQQRLQNPQLPSGTLLALVDSISTAVRPYSRRIAQRASGLADSVTAYNRGVADLVTVSVRLADKYPGCTVLADVRAAAAAWTLDTASYRGTVRTLDQYASEITKLVNAADRVRSSPELTQITRDYGPFDDPTVITLAVQRSSIGSDTVWRTVATQRISFGGRRRFGIGIGTTLTDVMANDYAVLRRYRSTLGSSPSDSIESVVVQVGASRRQLLPTATLSGRIRSIRSRAIDGVHVIIGTAPRSDPGRLTLDYMAGGALSAFSERMLAGVAVVSALERRLVSGLSDGARIPASQTTVPTRTARTFAGAYFVSFRIY
jgi:hypothetical protein